MKKILSIALVIQFITFVSYSQDTTGLIAHWKMNGNALDASGHGHNGMMNNVTNDTGILGAANTALRFNGTNSFISVPYSPAFDLSRYSICFIIKVLGFYSGLCQGNTVIAKGTLNVATPSGHYYVSYGDNTFDTSNCSHFDSTHEIFASISNANIAADDSMYNYFPTIQENKWYVVVCTFDSTTYKMYINDTLKKITTTHGYPIGSSNDSIVIGMDPWDAGAGYSYPMHAVLDDIKLFNRDLTAAEAHEYYDSTLPVAVPNIANLEPAVNIYPNPAKDNITISLPANTKVSMQLMNELGQALKEQNNIGNKEDIDISTLPAGMYILKLQFPEQTVYRKFIKE